MLTTFDLTAIIQNHDGHELSHVSILPLAMSSASPSPHRSLLNLRDGPSQHPEPSADTVLTVREGQISNETVELLRESVYSHTPSSIEDLPNLNAHDYGGVDIDKVALETQRREHAARPWWRRASATWWDSYHSLLSAWDST